MQVALSRPWTVNLKYLLLCCALAAISACSSNQTKTLGQQSVKPIPEKWAITAKLGIRTAEDSGSVTLNWQQNLDEYRIRVQGPLGQGSALIEGDRSFISIQRPGKDTVYSYDPAELIWQTFGWQLPIDNLRYWVRGISSPESPIDTLVLSQQGTLESLSQAQWELTFSRYEKIEEWLLPKRIRAKLDDTQLTLIIRTWDTAL